LLIGFTVFELKPSTLRVMLEAQGNGRPWQGEAMELYLEIGRDRQRQIEKSRRHLDGPVQLRHPGHDCHGRKVSVQLQQVRTIEEIELNPSLSSAHGMQVRLIRIFNKVF